MSGANTRKPIASAAIIGSGAVALSAALALKRALPQADIRVIQRGSGDASIAESILSIHPPAVGLLGLLGLDEAGLIRAGLASHKLGARFTGWAEAPFLVPVEEEEPAVAGVPLGLIERAQTGRREPARYSAAIALAEAGRFDPDGLHRHAAGEGLGYALQLDAEGFPALLRSLAEQAGVVFAHNDGSMIEPDLRLECDGQGQVLDGAPSEDWSGTIAGGEMLLWGTAGDLSLLDEYIADDWGWQAAMPGPRSTQHVAVSGAQMRAPHAPASARKLTFAAARLVSPMEGRRVALGDAAAVPGPLGGFGFTLALLHLGLLLDLMPDAEPSPLLAREYNRRSAIMSDEVRDFVGTLHMHSQRQSAFWKRMTDAGAPTDLVTATRHFARSGRVPTREVDVVSTASWARALDALVETEPGFDALARSVSKQQADAVLESRRNAVVELVRSQTDYRKWMQKEGRR